MSDDVQSCHQPTYNTLTRSYAHIMTPVITGCEEMDYTNTRLTQENGYTVIAYCICAAEREQKRRRQPSSELVAAYLIHWKKYVAKWKSVSINNGVSTGERISSILRQVKRGYEALAKEMKAPAKAAKEMKAAAEEKKAEKPKRRNAYHIYMEEVAKITKGVDMDIVIEVVTAATEDIEEWDALESKVVAKKVAKVVSDIIKKHKKDVKYKDIGKYVLATYTEDECIQNAFCHYFGSNEELADNVAKLVAERLDVEKEEDDEEEKEDADKEESDEEKEDEEQKEGEDKLVLPTTIENNRDWIKSVTKVWITDDAKTWKKMTVKAFIAALAEILDVETGGEMKPKLAPLFVQAVFDEDKLNAGVIKKFAKEEDIVGKIARKAIRLAAEQRRRR